MNLHTRYLDTLPQIINALERRVAKETARADAALELLFRTTRVLDARKEEVRAALFLRTISLGAG
jgi:hypothetical protein